MTVDDLRKQELIILECISGSKAYGLDTPESDTDIKGVFVMPKKDYYGLDYVKQVSNESNDIVFYELGRFMELLSVNNPNILELLNTPQDCVIKKSAIIKRIDKQEVLSKLCKNSFGKFAVSQIKKARGLKKKILNPVDANRKNPLAFCYINYDNGSISVEKYLGIKGWKQENCGLVNIPNMKDLFGLYYNEAQNYSGIIKSEDSNDICLSSIPNGVKQEALLYFNRDGYSTYCKDFREYWDWVDKRNETRYSNTKSHGKNYDSKNMMHTFRLLNMAIEIAEEKKINVRRADRDFLLKIKAGHFEYDELIELSNELRIKMEQAFEKSDLLEKPNTDYLKQLTFELRKSFYDN